jgi:hypothetical protein
MADPNVQYAPLAPTADPPVGRTVGPTAELSECQLTPEETADADLLYEELKPMATEEARNYVLARTPAVMQEYMATKIEADWPVPPAEDPSMTVRVQGEQGRVSVQLPAISKDSPQVAFAGKKLDPIRAQLDTGRDRNARRASP